MQLAIQVKLCGKRLELFVDTLFLSVRTPDSEGSEILHISSRIPMDWFRMGPHLEPLLEAFVYTQVLKGGQDVLRRTKVLW